MANIEQARLWNTTGADAWIHYVDEFDATLNPFGTAVMDRLALAPGQRVLDIGCGVGTTTRDLSSRVSPGHVVGADISQRMVTEARRRAAVEGIDNIDFIEVDAQTGDFGPTPFDVAFSRVGIMFFEDPTAAFTNIASSMAVNGQLGFICFQSPMLNPVLVVPVMTAAPHLEIQFPPPPGSPSPFSLADPEAIRGILQTAGFEDVTIEPGPDEAIIPGADNLEMVARRVLEQNPRTAPGMVQLPTEKVAAATAAVAEALAPFRDGDVLRMGAATWIVLARLGAS
ncbi:MAG: class I SAM-dependent methyltransferase [Microthrixaceae bacterium]